MPMKRVPRRKSFYVGPLPEHPVYSREEIKSVKIGSEEFKVPVKRIRGESEGQDHLLILGVLKNSRLQMPSPYLHAMLIQEVKKEFKGSVDDSRIHVLRDKDFATREFVRKAFGPVYSGSSSNEVESISKSTFLKQFNALAEKNSEIKNSGHTKSFLRSLVGMHENDSLPVDEVQGFYQLLLRERLDKALPSKRLTARKPAKGLLTEGKKKSLVRFERLSRGIRAVKTNKKDKVEEKSSEKTKADDSEEKPYEKFSIKAESESRNQGVNVNVGGGGGIVGGFGMYPNMWRNEEKKEEKKKEEDPRLKPRPVNYVAFAALIIIILIIMGIIFSS